MGFVKRLFTGPEKVKVNNGALNAAYNNKASYDAGQNQITGAANELKARPQIAIDQAPQQEFRGMQTGLAGNLAARAAGTAPSAAEMQLQRSTDRNLSNAVALAASSPGGGYGGNARGLARGLMETNRGASLDAAGLRATEQATAENTYANFLQGARAQDVGLATSQAQLSVEQQQAADNLALQYMQMGLSLEQARLKALQDMESVKLGVARGNADNQQRGDAAGLGFVSSLVGAAVSKK
jgi:hypothetical protein